MVDQPKQEIQLSPKAKMIDQVSTMLDTLLTEQMSAMPKAFNQTRFLQNCIAVLRDTKDIEKCSPISVARTMIKGAYLNLDFFRRECYAIPYGTELNFQTDYKGEIKVCKQWSSRPIQDIYAKLVREGDKLTIRIEGGKQVLDFEPLPFNDNAIIGCFAVVYYENGSMIYDAMSPKEIEDIRNKYSKMPNSPAWVKSLGEMYKKVVIRRLTKMVDLQFDRAEQDVAYEDGGDATFSPNKRMIDTNVGDPFPEKKIPVSEPADPIFEKVRAEHPEWNEWEVTDEVDRIKKNTKGT